jgi:hypothetical protein
MTERTKGNQISKMSDSDRGSRKRSGRNGVFQNSEYSRKTILLIVVLS